MITRPEQNNLEGHCTWS